MSPERDEGEGHAHTQAHTGKQIQRSAISTFYGISIRSDSPLTESVGYTCTVALM